MEKYKNILDVFLFAKDKGMCTTPYCTTCGSMDFRNMCKNIGSDNIIRLVKNVTDEELDKTSAFLWYDPLKILLIDGYPIDMNCPIKRRFDKGIDWLTTTNKEKEIILSPNCRVTGVIGSIFEENNVDVLVLFEYVGLAELPIRMRSFMKEHEIPYDEDSCVYNKKSNENIKSFYYVRTIETGRKLENVSKIICSTLDKIAAEGYNSIAMNGVKTLGYSELDNVRIINKWLSLHPESSIKTIRLVDKRGGFNKISI